jgi:hypothetical protein
MKASQLLKGKRAVHKVRFPICNFRAPILPDLPELAEQRAKDRGEWLQQHEGEQPPGDDAEVGLRVLTAAELREILTNALADAKQAGVEDPKSGDPIYDQAVMVHTLSVACVDPDNPDEPFFDGGVPQILESPHLGRDGISYLYEQQESWQDICSPRIIRVDDAEFQAIVEEIAGPDGFGFFYQLRPAMQWTCTHFMACLLLSLQTPSSASTSDSDASSKTSSEPPPKPAAAPPPVRKAKPRAKRVRS